VQCGRFSPNVAKQIASGVLLLYQTNTPRDLNVQQIARAIDNIAATYPDGIAGLVLALNDFNWK